MTALVRTFGKYERLAYERHERDLKEAGARGLRFDPEAGERVVTFIEQYCKHHKGEWAGQPLELQPFQRFVIRTAFGWLRADGLRRFRTMYVEIPRKNGKSTLTAGVGLYLLIADGEAGAEVYSSATKREQARIVWNDAYQMVKASADLRRFVKAFRSNLSCPRLGSKFEPLGADGNTLDGLNVHGNLVDELHAHRDRGVWDVLETAMGARRQPMTVAITTAGTYDQESIGWQIHEYATKVLDGVFADDTFFAFIAAADEGDDYFSPETFAKANPAYGVSVKPDDLEKQAEQAKRQPSFLNTFLRLRLNIWTQQVTRWLSLGSWGASDPTEPTPASRAAREEALAGRPCFGGLDLSSKLDLSAFVLAFPPEPDSKTIELLCRFYLPEEKALSEEKQGRRHYASWARDGWLTLTPGDVVDYDFIRRDVNELGHRFGIQEIAFDQWGAQALSTQLSSDGFKMVECRQGYKTLSEPSKDLEARIVAKQIRHGGDPVLRWCVSNAVVTTDSAGNIKPDKEKASGKIDGVVAAVMALSRIIVQDPDGGSAYEERGLLTL